MSPGRIGVPLSGSVVPAVEPAANALGDLRRQDHRGALRTAVHRPARHRSRSSVLLGFHSGPDLDPAKLLAVRIVPDRIAGRRQSVSRRVSREYRIDKIEHALRASPRDRRSQIGERETGFLGPRPEQAKVAPEPFRIGALEAEDRLLLVADREQRARTHALARAGAGEEFLGQLGDDAPLLRACVLRFVDQDMVEPAVQLVEHPLRGIAFLQQPDGRKNKIVVVEHGALALHALIFAEHGKGHRHHRLGQRCRDRRAPALLHAFHAVAQLLQPFRECGLRGRRALGHQVLPQLVALWCRTPCAAARSAPPSCPTSGIRRAVRPLSCPWSIR